MKSEMIDAICREIGERKKYIDETIGSIYFGGGTPSLLNASELHKILYTIQSGFTVEKDAEITLEANPDDLTKEKVGVLFNAGINRLSIGIQSFHDSNLKFMNRAHSAQEAMDSIKLVRDAGFEQLNLDLIYGIPDNSDEQLLQDLERFFEINPNHISAYCLTIEEKTAFGKWAKQGKMKVAPEEMITQQFNLVMREMEKHGFEQYEISNFCRQGQYSKHNTSYWFGKNYLGVGPGAHSYNGTERRWNVANNAHYIKQVALGEEFYEREELSLNDKINDHILTRLRTTWGVDVDFLLKNYQYNVMTAANALQNQKWLYLDQGNLKLTEEGKPLADYISSELFC